MTDNPGSLPSTAPHTQDRWSVEEVRIGDHDLRWNIRDLVKHTEVATLRDKHLAQEIASIMNTIFAHADRGDLCELITMIWLAFVDLVAALREGR